MGMFDNLKGKADQLKEKASALVDQHGDKIDQGLDKAGEMVDKKTGGKYTDADRHRQDQGPRAAGQPRRPQGRLPPPGRRRRRAARADRPGHPDPAGRADRPHRAAQPALTRGANAQRSAPHGPQPARSAAGRRPRPRSAARGVPGGATGRSAAPDDDDGAVVGLAGRAVAQSGPRRRRTRCGRAARPARASGRCRREVAVRASMTPSV